MPDSEKHSLGWVASLLIAGTTVALLLALAISLIGMGVNHG